MRLLYADRLIGTEFLNVPLGMKQRCGVDWKPTKDQIGDPICDSREKGIRREFLSPSFNDSRTAPF